MPQSGTGDPFGSANREISYARHCDVVDPSFPRDHVLQVLRNREVCTRALSSSPVRARHCWSEKRSEANKNLRRNGNNVSQLLGDVCSHGTAKKHVFLVSCALYLSLVILVGLFQFHSCAF